MVKASAAYLNIPAIVNAVPSGELDKTNSGNFETFEVDTDEFGRCSYIGRF